MLALAAPAVAQAPKAPKDASLYISAAQFEHIMQSAPVSKETGKPGSFSSRLFDGGTFSTAFIRLEKPDQPHAHGIWSEVFVVKQGSGTLTTGGKITGTLSNNSATHGAIFTDTDGKQTQGQAAPPARKVQPGDISGTAIEGGHDQKVSAGDVILIPAGVAHVWSAIDTPVVYLDIKFPKAE